MIQEDISYLMLHTLDFPENFVNKSHPDDFTPLRKPMIQLIYHRMPYHNRIFMRICVKVREDIFIPFTFICDTSAPMFIYVTQLTRRLISERIERDEVDNEFIRVNGKMMLVHRSSKLHSDTNIICLKTLFIFGLHLVGDCFQFDNLPEFL